ncbi:hypothetical protein HBH82_071780 [Parastagonospora nodorum]|nr:hypothetical protein HBH82_071780 [Parastagonospora nodorum]KAH4689361.1 hypothetical protein HBH78_091790 [Parastagonospora nodorum]KAH4704554.1 hypothetical protein HBH67_109380 [Parastagonospora nodorum]KAH4779820.1 hypothetical protein HBH62_142230 [Parastagonospora nodorum]KAH4790552.1 hypothetical protein HBH63_109020 [Parastagonospora nodorum]
MQDQHIDMDRTSSGNTTPTSDQYSLSNVSSVSSLSSSSLPKRSSMKSSIRSRHSTTSIRSSPPTVRFAEPELPSRPKPTPLQYQRQQNHPQRHSVQCAPTRYRSRPPSVALNPASSRYSIGPQPSSTLPPHNARSSQLNFIKPRTSQRFSASVHSLPPNRRQSHAKAPEDFTPPSLALERRVSSFQSTTSTFSVQSAPAALPSTTPPGPYNPLDNYIPCLSPSCSTLYSPTHLGLAFYLPQGPYSLSKLRGYCPTHAAQDLRDANAWCKSNYERLRQNAGRKTLGEIAGEFEIFLEEFRLQRKSEEKELNEKLKRRVIGSSPGGKQPLDSEWRWEFTTRHCTRASCPSTRYSPFANNLYAFYHPHIQTQSEPSSFAPLPTLCPECATNEVAAFERLITEKWGSRCGWHEQDWDEWIKKVVGERFEEKGFWEGAQEREVGEWVARRGEKIVDEVKVEKVEVQVEKRKKVGVFKRLFGKGGE